MFQLQIASCSGELFVSSGANMLLSGSQHFSSLNILAGGTARMVQDGTAVLEAGID